MVKYEEKICPVCGKKFEGRIKQTYCSVECRNKAHIERYTDYRKEYYKKNAEEKKAYQKELSKRERVEQEKVCPTCGKPFTTSDSRQKYCCMECRYEASQKKVKEAYDNKRVFKEKICVVCGKPFTTTHDIVICCSEECSEENRKAKQKAYQSTPEYKKKHSERTINYNHRIQELGMTISEFNEMKEAGIDVDAYLAERKEKARRICVDCGKEFYDYREVKFDKKCPDCREGK